MTAAAIVKALGGRGNMARCPVHKAGKERTPSLSVTDGPNGKLLVNCKAGCSQAAVWAALQDRGLVGNGTRSQPAPRKPTRQKSDAQRRAEALTFWEESGLATYSPAAEYFRCRGIMIPLPPCIRYHRRSNALVAIVQARDGTFSGIQRIYLTTDSRGTWKRPIEKPKRAKGIVKGGAVWLTPAAETIQLTESVEDGLALLQLTGRPTWAVPGAGFMEHFEPPPKVRELVLAPDNDPAGLKAIEKTIQAFAQSRTRIRQLLPPAGADWCQMLETVEERAAIREFDGEQDRQEAEQRSWMEAFCNGD